MKSIYLVQHLHTLPQDGEDVKTIGVYATREDAIEAASRLALQPGFRDHPNVVDFDSDIDMQGFHIDEYEIGMDHWQEGYGTV
jgi:hypothetical protein